MDWQSLKMGPESRGLLYYCSRYGGRRYGAAEVKQLGPLSQAGACAYLLRNSNCSRFDEEPSSGHCNYEVQSED